MSKNIKTIRGTISITGKGIGFLKTEGKEDIEIDFNHLNTALHGDTVEVALSTEVNKRVTGEVLKIISRAKNGFSGTLEQEKGVFFLNPDDTKMYTDILIPKEGLGGAKVGQKVYAEIVFWKDPRKIPEGKIVKVLGKPGDNNAEMYGIALEKGFDNDFPKKVEEEAEKIKNFGIKKENLDNRKDFRKTLTFTIDPEDAKDFDDAISFRDIGKNKYEIGIHIADVSSYVKTGSELDREAKKRGTSVYLVDRTIPMLPETLSNDLCSLLPGKDRLTFGAVFTMDNEAKILTQWFGHTLINSKKRFTYEEAQKSIDDKNGYLHRELQILNNLANKFKRERFKNGAISLDQEEVKFVLDKDGKPIKVVKKERNDSNRLIEEFMLLANKKVAEVISKSIKNNKKGVFVYRVHDYPSKEKMADLAFFLKSLGYKISFKKGLIPKNEINEILRGLSDSDTTKNTIQRVVVRSMAKAVYSTKNIGHYGLAFEYYAHFTSPIRRYPDIVVHRLLDGHLKNKKINENELGVYEEISRKSSEREKYAAEAERASIKYKQVEYMSSRIGKTFRGIISGITEWGIYVEEAETKCEGLIRMRDLGDDFYIFDEKKIELVGKRSKKKYRLGDIVKIKVKGTDLERKTIDYLLN